MASAFTGPVQEGVITEFPDFALKCARAIGPFVLMRDDSDTSPEATRRAIVTGRYLEDDSYGAKHLTDIEAELARVRDMYDGAVLAAAQAQHDDAVRLNEESVAERERTRTRYEAMIEKVEAWDPPTSDHAGLKEFMLSQLHESLEHDCHDFTFEVPEVSLSWREQTIERLEKQAEDQRTRNAEAAERNEWRRAWVAALVESLGLELEPTAT